MKKTLLLSLLAVSAAAASAQTPIDYRIDQVKRSVVVKSGAAEARAVAGTHAQSGDRVQTGWFSYALISSGSRQARFEIFSGSDVTLAETTPGVILSLERGRIRAAFDKITGSEPRVVKTPGALLAVRGTQFDVRVDSAGKTTVDVYEGVVEVQSFAFPAAPLFVRAGEETSFGRRETPQARPMPEHRRRDAPDQRGEGKDGDHKPPPRTGDDPSHRDPRGGTHDPRGNEPRDQPRPPAPQPPPPQPPGGGGRRPPGAAL